MASPLDIQERIPFAEIPERVDGEVLTTSRARGLALLNGIICMLCRSRLRWVCVFLLTCIVFAPSSFALIIYVICYFGREDHFLQFLSHICYWPTVMSAQIILIVALCVQCSAEDVKETSWANVFRPCNNEGKMNNGGKGSFCSRFNRFLTWMVYLGLPAGHAALKIFYSTKFHPECFNKREKFFLTIEIVGVFFFSAFCYFLLTRRKDLQKSRRESIKYIQDHINKLNLCIEKTRALFHEYYQLQTFVSLWLYLTVLSSMFGIGVCVTWNYNKIQNSTSSVPSYQGQKLRICTQSCDTRDFMREDNVLLLYNLWVFWRHLMILILPCISAGGLDVSHVWDDFKMDLSSLYSSDKIKFWDRLRKFVKNLHPKQSSDKTVSLLLGVGALAVGMLSGHTSNF